MNSLKSKFAIGALFLLLLAFCEPGADALVMEAVHARKI